MKRLALRVLILALAPLALPWMAFGYPGGTPDYVTDVGPFCAGCHASVSADQLVGVPEPRVKKELAQRKHLAKIHAPREGSPYASLTEEQRGALIRGIQRIDKVASVQLVAPKKLQPGQVFEVTVEATGGAGPVVGLALVDSNQRWQSRPAPSAGWLVLEKPAVVGPDGKPQTTFTDRRNPELAPGLAYVNVYGVSADLSQERFDTVSATFRLRAPIQPGTYPIGAVFLYGTEKAAPYGAVETLRGKSPLGGSMGNAGRIRFSEIVQIDITSR
jgi:hypothetical protein